MKTTRSKAGSQDATGSAASSKLTERLYDQEGRLILEKPYPFCRLFNAPASATPNTECSHGS